MGVAAFIGEARSWFTTTLDSEDVEIWVASYLSLTLILNIYTTREWLPFGAIPV